MTINTEYDVGQTVYRTTLAGNIVAHKIVSIDIGINENGSHVTYDLTRNLDTSVPSGGDKSNIQASELTTELPSTKMTREEIYNHLFAIFKSDLQGFTEDARNRKATKFAVTNTNYFYYHQDEL